MARIQTQRNISIGGSHIAAVVNPPADSTNIPAVLLFRFKRARRNRIRIHGCLQDKTSAKNLRVNTAKSQGPSYTVNRHNIRSDSIVNVMRLSIPDYLFETVIHHVLQALIYLIFTPEKALAILHPFEITHGNTTGISENVRDNKNSLILDDRIRVRRRGAIGTFAKDLAVYTAGILSCNLILGGGRHQNIAGVKQNLLRRHFCPAARKLG